MTRTVRLCSLSDLATDSPVAVEPEGLPALAVYRIGEDYFVTDNQCTHGGALLTDGLQDGDTIECPFHGGTFDIRTGEATTFPCVDALKTYEVVIDDGFIGISVPVSPST